MERWSGKVAIVTGASAGIGAAVAKLLVAAGMKVVGLARRVETIEALAATLPGPGTLYAIKTDLTQEEDIMQAFAWIKTNLGPVHVLINNAGMMKNGDLLTLTTPDLRTTLDTNVVALMIAAKEAANDMMANSIDGHIVNVNSVLGHVLSPHFISNVYPATKHAVKAVTQTLRFDLARLGSKIKVTSCSPGLVKTEFQDNFPGEMKEALASMNGLSADEVADAILYVLGTPPNVNISEIIVQPVGEMF